MIFRFRPTRAPLLFALLVAGLAGIQSSAQNLSVDKVAKGATIVTSKSIPIRSEPPSVWPLYTKGAQVAVSPPGQPLIVRDSKVVPTILGSQKWAYIESAPSGKSTASFKGWVYLGSTGGITDGFSAAKAHR